VHSSAFSVYSLGYCIRPFANPFFNQFVSGMRFLNNKDSATPQEISMCFDAYARHLDEKKGVFPQNAFEFASSTWHYDPTNSKCPHDAWLRKLEIVEKGVPRHSDNRTLNIRIVLLGAYHDGFITLKYSNVHSYSLEKPKFRTSVRSEGPSHGDWLFDEISLNDEALVCHEIEFANASPWIIVCEDIQYSWRQVREREPH